MNVATGLAVAQEDFECMASEFVSDDLETAPLIGF